MIRPADRQPDYTQPGVDVHDAFLEHDRNMVKPAPKVTYGEVIAGIAFCVFFLILMAAIWVAFSPESQAFIDKWRASNTISCPWPRS